ncbi:MAG: YqaJ viral recombinase family protein [bacterium]
MATVLQPQAFTNEERQKYIGGSDISAVMGLNRWKTPLKLWAEKTGKIEPADLSNVDAVKMGNTLEEFVAQQFSTETGKTVRRAPKKYTHKEYDFMGANIDRLVTGTDELLECKTCSLWKKDEWGGDDIPQEYILQVMWYLGITGRKTGYIAVLIGGQHFRYKKIDFDSELFETMIEQALEFWNCVQNDIPPAILPADSETLLELYPSHSVDIIENMEIEDKVAYLQELKMHIKSMQDEQKEIETELKNIINENMGVKTPNYVVTWKEQTSKRVDTQRLKDDGIYEQYLSESSTRVLRIAKNKGVA